MKAFRFVFGGIALGGFVCAPLLLRGAAEVVAPAQQSATAAQSAVVAAPSVENGYLKISFDHLASFTFVPPAFDAAEKKTPLPTGEEQIPAFVKAWNGKKAEITGFMVPVKMEKGLATEFLVMRNTFACCYGGTPAMTEWVIAKMKKGGVPVTMDVPVAFFGDLKVGAIFENGYLSGIYQLDCERMGEVKN